MGNLEIHDLEAAVAWARELGYENIATVGFPMGAAVAVRHAALIGGVDAVVAVSAPKARLRLTDSQALCLERKSSVNE